MVWAVEHHVEPAGAFHGRPFPEDGARAVWRCTATKPALVLGSTQGEGVVDHEAAAVAGFEIVRRRSGGGVVLVDRSLLWVDVLLPAGDPLWEDDVSRSALWLGRAWSDSFASLGVVTQLHEGALRRTRWSASICFAGLAPGELTDIEGRKVLGISQRRTRAGARFQCAALGAWDPAALASLLRLTPEEREGASAELADLAAPTAAPADGLFDSLLRHLPDH